MGIIRKIAVRAYKKQVNSFTKNLLRQDIFFLGSFVADSVWLRASGQILGVVNFNEGLIDKGWVTDTGIDMTDDIHACPGVIQAFLGFVVELKKRGDDVQAAKWIIWLYSIQAIARPEIAKNVKEMWDVLIRSKDYWEMYLDKIFKNHLTIEDDEENVKRTYKLAKAIMKKIPPIQVMDPDKWRAEIMDELGIKK